MPTAATTLGMRGTSRPAKRIALASSYTATPSRKAATTMNDGFHSRSDPSMTTANARAMAIAAGRFRPVRAVSASLRAPNSALRCRSCASESARAARARASKS